MIFIEWHITKVFQGPLSPKNLVIFASATLGYYMPSRNLQSLFPRFNNPYFSLFSPSDLDELELGYGVSSFLLTGFSDRFDRFKDFGKALAHPPWHLTEFLDMPPTPDLVYLAGVDFACGVNVQPQEFVSDFLL